MNTFRLPIWVRAAWFVVALLAAGSAVRANGIQWNSISLGGVQEGGKNLEIVITATNTGGETWNGAHNLVMRAPNGDAMAMAGIEGVEPGQTVTTTIVWGIPEAGGTFAFTVQALEHEVEYFSVGGSYSISAPPAPPYTGVALAPLTFDALNRPTISSTDVQPGWPTYRLRAKVIDGSSYGFHMAHQYDKQSYVVDLVPPPGNYAVTALYWVKYNTNGSVMQIGPRERRESITVRDTVHLVGGSPGWAYFHELEPPMLQTSEMLGGHYRLMATFRSGADSWETAGELGNNYARLKWLPPAGSYSVGLRWKRYDAAMNLIDTSPEKLVPVQLTSGLWTGLDVSDGGIDEISWWDEDAQEERFSTSTSVHDFYLRVPGLVTISLTAGFQGRVRNGNGDQLGDAPGVVTLPAAGWYQVEVTSGNPGSFQLSGSFSTSYQSPQITSAATAPAGAVGSVFPGYTVTASGTGPLTFSAPPADVAGGLPPGLSLNPTTGAITGTPTQGGTYRTWISVENTGGRGGKWVTFAIKTLPVIPLVGETKTNGDLKLTVTAAMLPTAAQPPLAGMPAPTGALQYSGKWISHDPASLGESSANVPAQLPMYPNPWGTLQVTATYVGDANYLPATETVEFKVVDTLPPDLGTNVGFSVGSKTSTGLSLSWQPVSDLSGAIVGRPSQGVTYQASLDNGPATASFSVPGKDFNGLAPGTSHTVRIRAIDQWGNTTGWSFPFSVDLPASSSSPTGGNSSWADVNGDGLPDELIPAGDRFLVSPIGAYTEVLTYNDWVQDIVQFPGSWQYVDTVRRFKSSDGTVIRWIEPEWQFVPGDQIPVWTTESTTVEVEMVVPTYEFVAEGGDRHEIVQVITTTDGKTLYGRVAGDLIFGERGAGTQSVFWTTGTTVAALSMQAFPTKLARLGTPPTGTQVAIPGLPGGGNIEVYAGTSGVSGTMTLPNGITIRAGGGSASISMKGSAGSITVGSNGSISGQANLPGGWTVSGGTDGNATITGPDGTSLRVGSGGTTLSLPNGAGITVSNTGAISLSLPAGLGAAIGGVLDDLGRVLGLPPGTAVRRAVIPQGPSNAPVIWENGDGGLANLPPGYYSVGSSPDNRTEADGQLRTPAPDNTIFFRLEIVPRIEINEIGFKGGNYIWAWNDDANLRRKIDFPDGSEPTWKSVNNPNLPASYPRQLVFGGNLVVPSEDPKLFARFALSSASTAAIAIRVKEGSRIVGQVTGIQANGAVVSLSELVCSIQKPDRGGLVVHELKWEALIGNGGWSQIAATTHRIFWTESAVFANDQAPLYDLALEKASAYINHPQTGASGPSLGAIALSICRGLEREVYYNPKIVEPQQQSEMLRIYSMVSGVQCTGHAKLMQTLVQAMGHTGLDVAVLYVWGGVGGTGKRMVLFDKEVGFYKDLGVSFGCSRPAEDDARNNPFFVFHALIVAGGVVYDPTYGLVGEPALVEFAPPDRDLSPLGNFPGTEDKDNNSDGIFDVPQRMSGDFEAFFPAWEARKYFYLR